MKKSKLQFLKGEFPGFEEDYFQLLLHGILNLSKAHIIIRIEDESELDQYIAIDHESWQLFFSKRERYYSELLKIWPVILLFETAEQLKLAISFDESLEVFRNSKFGIFLANTKIVTSIYPELKTNWSRCYSSWVHGCARILHPYSGLSKEVMQQGIQQAVNEVVLHSEKYSKEPEVFKTLITRHYRLMLTEQNL